MPRGFPMKKKKVQVRSKKNPKKLARLQPSATRAAINNQIYNTLKKFSETKIIPVTRYDNQGPLPIQVGNVSYWNGFVLGRAVPSTWTGAWNVLNGIATQQGDTNFRRDGNYIYLNKTHVTFQLNMTGEQEASTLHEFRMIVFKTRRATNPIGLAPDPSESLFIDELGNPFGHATTTGFGTPAEYPVDLMVQPLNKRQFYILQDKKFVLSPQQTIPTGTETATGFNSKYQSYKRFALDLNHKIKCRVPEPAIPTTPVEPTNYDFAYGVVFYSRPINRVSPADDWDISVRGTTTFMDN